MAAPTRSRPRDSQRSRCYAAERDVLAVPRARGRRLTDRADLVAFVTQVRAEAVVRGDPLPVIRVGTGSGSRHARATWHTDGRHTIQIPLKMRSEMIVLHEIAHCAVVDRHGIAGAAAHGWQWAALYVELVERHLGERTAQRLRDAFTAHRVRLTAP